MSFLPRSARKTSLETRTGRLAQRVRRAPYFVKIAKGLHLGYYRGATSGSWIARRYCSTGAYENFALGHADDTLEADGVKVLDFWQAQDAARKWAERSRLIDAGVVRRGTYTVEHAIRRLVNACQGEFRRLVQGAMLSGCRYSELARLKCGDFNPDSGTLAIRLSKGRMRHVVLTDDGRNCFALWTVGKVADQYVFLRSDDRAWSKNQQIRPLELASGIASLSPPVGFHVLRHTHGSHLAMQGVPFGVIAKQLGHADTRMTERHYAHLAPSYVAETIRAKFPSLGITDPSPVVPLRERAALSK